MTAIVGYKNVWGRGIKRKMVAADLGMDLLRSPFDPILLAAGIRAPRLTAKQTLQMRAQVNCHVGGRAFAAAAPRERSEYQKMVHRMRNTVAERAARQEVSDILSRLRRMGEVRG